MSDFLQTVRERVVIYDGAMGTNIQLHNPTLDDYWGKENCSEVLVLSRPDIIKDIHASFLQVDCDVVETNTFGGTRVVLGEFGLQDKVAEINIAAAKLARTYPAVAKVTPATMAPARASPHGSRWVARSLSARKAAIGSVRLRCRRSLARPADRPTSRETSALEMPSA